MAHTDPSLAVVVPDGLHIDGNSVTLSDKSLSGLVEEFASWTAPVTVVGHPSEHLRPDDPGSRTVRLNDLPFRMVAVTDRAIVANELRTDLMTALLTPNELPTLRHLDSKRLVALVENNLRNRILYGTTNASGGLDRLRISLGATRHEVLVRKIARRCAGLQANGAVAYEAYRSTNTNTMRFFDSRARASTITATMDEVRDSSAPLRLAFSGRWVAQKGFLDAIQAFLLARRTGANVTLDLLGTGELADEIPQVEGLRVIGPLDYETAWIPYVTAHVDALLIPHRQGDPSCTYVEGMACGAPFISFANDAARSLAGLSGSGWVAPLNDIDALAETIRKASQDRAALRRHRERAIAFARTHSFEAEYRRRADHLRSTWSEIGPQLGHADVRHPRK